MANFIIDGNLFKNIQSQIKRETEKFLGKGKGVSVQLPEIREFVVENQNEMFANGGKAWVVNHFVEQVRSQSKSLAVVDSVKSDIDISYNYTDSTPNTELPIPAQQQAPLATQQTAITLPSEILAEVQTKFSNYSQEVQMELVNHLQELNFQSALELRQKLNELSQLESKLLVKVLGDYRTQHESNLSTLRQTLAQTTDKVNSQSENFTQQFNQRKREIELMFGL